MIKENKKIKFLYTDDSHGGSESTQRIEFRTTDKLGPYDKKTMPKGVSHTHLSSDTTKFGGDFNDEEPYWATSFTDVHIEDMTMKWEEEPVPFGGVWISDAEEGTPTFEYGQVILETNFRVMGCYIQPIISKEYPLKAHHTNNNAPRIAICNGDSAGYPSNGFDCIRLFVTDSDHPANKGQKSYSPFVLPLIPTNVFDASIPDSDIGHCAGNELKIHGYNDIPYIWAFSLKEV